MWVRTMLSKDPPWMPGLGDFSPADNDIIGLYARFRHEWYEREPALRVKDQAWQALLMAQIPHRTTTLWGLLSYPVKHRDFIIDAAPHAPEMAGRWAIERGADPDAIRTSYMLIYGQPFPF